MVYGSKGGVIMEKVYVVKSVLVDKDSLILRDDKGLGVYLTYEDAKEQFDKVVSDLKECYEGDPGEYIIHIDAGCGLNDFFSYHRVGDNQYFCDFVGLYECEVGKWELY